jgi:predicted ATP-grasp superfamily ATP-dependent carboligase
VHRFGDFVLDRLGEGAGGWIGIDFVYREFDGELAMTAIEVNPRWTTSYVGIRHLYRGNLLLDMLALDQGAIDSSTAGSRECWRTLQISWHASGRVESGD